MAGLVVGVVALPLSMALAIASGVPPQHGLYTAIVAGIVCALLGGTRCQVTGPTAAFVVILVPIVARFGIGGLLVAGLMAGVILVAMGALKLGSLIQYIPHPVTTGFTAGIARGHRAPSSSRTSSGCASARPRATSTAGA